MITRAIAAKAPFTFVAADMAAAGIDLGAIMPAGGWKSPDAVMRYIEHMDVQKSGMRSCMGQLALSFEKQL